MLQNLLEKTTLQKKLLIALSVLFICVVVFSSTLFLDIQKLQSSSQMLNHTHKVIAQAQNLIKLMVDQETGLRGYIIVGKENFLEPFYSGKDKFSFTIQQLGQTVSDNPGQVFLLKKIEKLFQQWQLQVAGPEIVDWRKSDNLQSSLNKIKRQVKSEVGKSLMDKLRIKVDEFIRNEQILIEQRKQINDNIRNRTLSLSIAGSIFILMLGFAIIILINRTSLPLNKLIAVMREIAESSDFTRRVEVQGMYEVNQIAAVFNRMALNTEQQAWLKNSAMQLSKILQEAKDEVTLANSLCSKLGELLCCGFCAFYLYNKKNFRYELIGSYRFKESKHRESSYATGEGLIGQCALEDKLMLLNNVPEDYTKIHSGLGEATPDTIMAAPISSSDKTLAVLELATFGSFSEVQQALLEQQLPNIALGLKSLLNSLRTQELLEETQAQTEELQVREEELNDSNSLLEQQAQELKKSQEELQESNAELQGQQKKLQLSNQELEQKAEDLNASQAQLEERNEALNEVKQELEKRAEQLSISSKYKSEFLANMSHELRTPLNSLLILSQLLMNNKEGNLTEKQLDYARTVHNSGDDLLNLINDILDLSKIESGHMEVNIELIQLSDFIHSIKNNFSPMAEKKGISLDIHLEQATDQCYSDHQKLSQIIKNLLSNALKFTEHGSVSLTIGPLPEGIKPINSKLLDEECIAMTVADSGIGIPENKQQQIFEAFQQADGSTSRKFGGTGLGLSISRELARLLQGEIHLQSEQGKGSSFTLILPQQLKLKKNTENTPKLAALVANSPAQDSIKNSSGSEIKSTSKKSPATPVTPVTPITTETAAKITDADHQLLEDDRQSLKAGDKSLLIIEDDLRFASIVADIARERGYGVLAAENGHTGLYLADLYRPNGIVLDLGLPDLSGLQVMEQLKNSPRTRHIPVHIMSASDRSLDAMKGGAIGFYTKPVSIADLEQSLSRIEDINKTKVKHLLLVDNDETHLKSMQQLLTGEDVDIIIAKTGKQAQKQINAQPFDCIVLDIDLPDMSGLKLLKSLHAKQQNAHIPVVICSDKELDPKERAELDHYAQSVIIKNVRSPERLLDDTTLFLHRVEDDLPEQQRHTIQMLHNSEKLFIGRKVLLVDDDMRNIFSLSALLQEKEIDVHTAANGKEALEILANEADIALVLMDIMMPEMDGYEAMRRIRKQQQFKTLPIIALTAKAMKGDRAKCIECGANDYLAKPVDTQKLLSMMRVWLYQ